MDFPQTMFSTIDDKIFCIDNDISFANPIVQKTFSSCINFCSALFCHFQEKALDRAVLEEFCHLDPDAILQSWIEDVIRKEAEYLSLFSVEERARLYEEDPDNRFKATILFRQGELATLNVQFVYLQNQLNALLEKGGEITSLELLKNIIYVADNFTISAASGSKIAQAYSFAKKYPAGETVRLDHKTASWQIAPFS